MKKRKEKKRKEKDEPAGCGVTPCVHEWKDVARADSRNRETPQCL
jgi:hypothetical protein